MKTFLFTIVVTLWSATSQAQEVIELIKSVKIASEEASSAKQQLMDKAIEEASMESIQGLIGEEKTLRSKNLIENKIIKQSRRYVLSVQNSNFSKKNNEYLMDVQMKVSLKGLRALLLENGLLYQLDGPPKVLPVVQIVDRINAVSYGWWFQGINKDKSALSRQLESIHQALRDKLQEIGFYSMMPVKAKYSQAVPEAYRGENLQRADYLFLGEFFKSSVVVRGQIIYRNKPLSDNSFLIDLRLEALHTGNGRLMAEVSRVYETDTGSATTVINKKLLEVLPQISQDLSAQLSEAWKKGTFGASVIRLSVRGSITPAELDEFKKVVILQVKDVKSLRERLIESGQVTFEVDSSSLPLQLAQVFKSTEFKKFAVRVDSVSSDGLSLDVSSKSSGK